MFSIAGVRRHWRPPPPCFIPWLHLKLSRTTIIVPQKHKTKQVTPFGCWNPYEALASLVLCNRSRNIVLFANSPSPLPQVLALQDMRRHQTLRAYAPLSWASSVPRFRGVGSLCLEVWPGTWDPDPFLDYQYFFLIENDLLFGNKTVDGELGQTPTSQGIPRDTDDTRPSNLAASTLSFVEHTLTMYASDPIPARRRFVAALTFFVRKVRFNFVGSNQKWLITTHGFTTIKKNLVLVSIFWNDNNWPQLSLWVSLRSKVKTESDSLFLPIYLTYQPATNNWATRNNRQTSRSNHRLVVAKQLR